MNKYIKALITSFIVIGLFFLRFTVNAKTIETVKDFQSNFTVNKNGTISVEEVIRYDFGDQQKHGIYRDISTRKENQDGKIYKLKISVQSVNNENGSPYKYTTPSKTGYESLKIGDPNNTITGEHIYVIKYTVSGAITYFSDHDELYWNITGNDWEVPITLVTSKITLPLGIPNGTTKIICYEGSKGSISQNCFTGISQTTVMTSTNKPLGINEGLSFVVSFPKGYVDILEPQKDNSGLIAKIMSAIFSLLLFLWFVVLPIKILVDSLKEKRFTKNNERIVAAWFEPPQYENKIVFSPAETGLIIDKTIDHKELTGTIIYLAQRGYLKIRNDGKRDFSFIKLKDYTTDTDLRDFERKTLEVIFDGKDEVKVTDLKDSSKFLSNSQKFKKDVEEELMTNKMFEKKPSVVALSMIALGMFALFTMNLFLAFVCLAFGRKSAKRTLIGIEKYSEAKSLFNFLKSQDEKLDFQAQNQMFFEKLLPYATAFGAEKIWAERFKGIDMVKPDWYEGEDFSDVMALSYMSNSLASSVHSSMSPTSSSSGFSSGFSGGSSGGGGGGGGGGSW